MIADYYIDESGNTGDLVNAGDAFNFGQQPIFALSCVGIDDPADLDREVEKLRTKHRIQGLELKSSSVREKPGFVIDILAYLAKRHLPVFVEVVDKRFFICATMVNHTIMPPVGETDADIDTLRLKNLFGEYMHAEMPPDVMQGYIEACQTPSIDSTRSAIKALLRWLRPRMPADEIAAGLYLFAADTLKDLEELGASEAADALAFLPVPDASKADKPYWMLPHLSSFTNIYARINLLHRRRLSGVRLLHDEQLQYDNILGAGKLAAERFTKLGLTVPIRCADFAFDSVAQLAFAKSHSCAGIQVADVLAGFAMRYVQDGAIFRKSPAPLRALAFHALIGSGDPSTGPGVNFVMPTRDIARLGVLPLSE